MAIYSFIGDVEPPAGEPSELRFHLRPGKILPDPLLVREIKGVDAGQ